MTHLWPVVYIRFDGPPGMTLDEKQDYMTQFLGLYQQQKSFILLIDTDHVVGGEIPLHQLAELAMFHHGNRAKAQIYLKGIGLVVRDQASRDLVSTLFTMYPPETDIAYGASLAEIDTWVSSRISMLGITQ